MNNIPSIPLVGFIDNLVEWLRLHASFIFNPIRDFINFTVELFIKIFSVFPPLIFIILVAALAYYLTKKI